MSQILNTETRAMLHALTDDEAKQLRFIVAEDDGTFRVFDGMRALVDDLYREGEPNTSKMLLRLQGRIAGLLGDAAQFIDIPTKDDKQQIAALPTFARCLLSPHVGGTYLASVDAFALAAGLLAWWRDARETERLQATMDKLGVDSIRDVG